MTEVVSFPYEAKESHIFRFIRRPVAQVAFFSLQRRRWIEYAMIVDTGADYTVFPFKASLDLGLDIKQDCFTFSTRGIGGTENVYLYKKKIMIKVGEWQIKIPIGFLERDDIPPLLGRNQCLDAFKVIFSEFVTSFTKIK